MIKNKHYVVSAVETSSRVCACTHARCFPVKIACVQARTLLKTDN